MAAIDIIADWITRNTDRFARQIITTLNTNGYTIIRIPGPDTGGQPTWTTPAGTVTIRDARIHLDITEPMRALDGQALAAATLAAAYALGATE